MDKEFSLPYNTGTEGYSVELNDGYSGEREREKPLYIAQHKSVEFVIIRDNGGQPLDSFRRGSDKFMNARLSGAVING